MDLCCISIYFFKGTQFISSISPLYKSFMTDGSKHTAHRMDLPGTQTTHPTREISAPPTETTHPTREIPAPADRDHPPQQGRSLPPPLISSILIGGRRRWNALICPQLHVLNILLLSEMLNFSTSGKDLNHMLNSNFSCNSKKSQSKDLLWSVERRDTVL